MVRRIVVVGLLLLAAIFLWPIGDELARQLPSFLFGRSPHDQYVRQLQKDGLAETAEGRAWLAAADRVLQDPDEVSMAFARSSRFDAETSAAHGWRFLVRRGQLLTIDVAFAHGGVFIDLFRSKDGERLASTSPESSRLTYTVKADEEVVARVQPELQRA